jgi:hypothetical protein
MDNLITALRLSQTLSGYYMNPTVAQHLCETAAWCMHTVSKVDLATSTRTAKICPDMFCGQDCRGQLESIHSRSIDIVEALSQIRTRRQRLVESHGLKIPCLQYCLTAGRVFGTHFDTDLCEAATDVSNGFFDLSDIPGWDTWFAHQPSDIIQGIVFGWIPNEICAEVGRGMWAIPVDSAWWVNPLPENAR